MFDFNDPSITVQMCKFQADIQKAHVVIKFPCSYFVQWRTINNRYSICTQTRVRAANDQAVFNQKLTFYTQMVFNTKKKEYYSKQTFLVLNLVSKSRPDQIKLVGRISVDLADIMNRKRFNELTHMKLNYCSVEGSIVFKINLLNKRDSNLSVKDLDRSAFTDYFSLNPINRIMIQESISGNYATKPNNYQQNLPNFSKQSNNPAYYENDIQSNHFNKVPTFATVESKPHQQYSNSSKPQIISQNIDNINKQKNTSNINKQRDQQIISFNNNNSENYGSQRQDQNQNKEIKMRKNQSSRTQSKQQSLIQRLQQKHLVHGQRQRGNVVQINSRQPKTDRFNNLQSETQKLLLKNNSSKRLLNKVPEQNQGGQIKKQNVSSPRSKNQISSPRNKFANNNNNFNQQQSQQNNSRSLNTQQQINQSINYPANNTFAKKPTSPPSNQRSLNHVHSQSKFSQTSQQQNQQLLNIVSKLQNQKKQQQSMIRQLKSIILNKDMKKKKQASSIIEASEEINNKQKQLKLENNALRGENYGLKQQVKQLKQDVISKDRQLSEKNKHIYQLLDKIRRLETQLAQLKIYIDQKQRQLVNHQNQRQIRQSNFNFDNLQHSFKNKLAFQLNQKGQLIHQTIESPFFKKDQTSQFLEDHSQQPHDENQIRITVTKDENIYQDMEKENAQLCQRVKQLEEENQKYRELLKTDQQNMHESLSSLKYSTLTRQFMINAPPKMQQNQIRMTESLQNPLQYHQNKSIKSQPQFRITISKNQNIYQNYESLEQQNTQLYQRIKQLEQQIQKYKDLLKEDQQTTSYGQVQHNNNFEFTSNLNGLIAGLASQQPPQQQIIHQEMLYTANQEEQNDRNGGNLVFGLLSAGNNRRDNQFSLQNNQNHQNRAQSLLQCPVQHQNQNYIQNHGLNLIGQTFKIILTKDKNIYAQQQQQNIQLSKRVIQLQQQIQKYKDIVKCHTQSPSQNKIPTQNDNGFFNHRANSLEREQQYQDIGFKITLTKDKNIFQNQELELTELQTKIDQLQCQLKKYKSLYGDLNTQPQYKISITRSQNIYEDQEMEIKDLLKCLAIKDDQLMELMKRISILQAELEQYRPSYGAQQAMIKINIKRDENIYDEQQIELRELSSRVIELEDKIMEVHQELRSKEEQIQSLKANKSKDNIESTQNNPNGTNGINKLSSLSKTLSLTQTPLPQTSCSTCQKLKCQVQQLQMTIQLVQQQKSLLEQQIGSLQQQKFCLNSTQNQLKIQIQELQEQLNIYRQQNQRYCEELHYMQQNYRDGQNGQYQQQGYQEHQQYQQYVERQQVLQQHLITNTDVPVENISVEEIQASQLLRNMNEQQFATNSRDKHILPQNQQSQASQVMQNSTTKMLDSLYEQNSQLRQKLTLFQQQLQQQCMTIAQLQDRISRLMHDKQILLLNQEQNKQEIEASNKKNNTLIKNVQGYKKQIQQCHSRIRQLEGQVRVSQETIINNKIGNNNQKYQITTKIVTNQLSQDIEATNASSQLITTSISHHQQSLQLRQFQLQTLRKQIQQIHSHLIQLTESYQSLQQMFFQLESKKNNQVEQIKYQSQLINKIVQNQIDVIQNIIVERKKKSLEQQIKIKQYELKVFQLTKENQKLRNVVSQLNDKINTLNREGNVKVQSLNKASMSNVLNQQEGSKLKQQNDSLRQQHDILKQQYEKLKQQNTDLIAMKQQRERQYLAQPHKNNTKNITTPSQITSLIQHIQSISNSQSSCQRQISQLRPLIQQKINSFISIQQNQAIVPEVINQKVISGQELSIAKRIFKQIQKIKVSIMKGGVNNNNTGSTNYVYSAVNKSVGSVSGFKTFAEKNAVINYFKPLQQMLKDY